MNEFMDCEAWPVGAPFLGIPGKYVTFENGATAEDKSRDLVTARDYGAKGDGVTNDTQAFIDLETTHQGRIVELLGKTYLVDKTPYANKYVNGNFLVGSSLIPANGKQFDMEPLDAPLQTVAFDSTSGLMWSWYLSGNQWQGHDSNAVQSVAFDEKNRYIYAFYETGTFDTSSVLYRISMDRGTGQTQALWGAGADRRLGHQGLAVENNRNGSTFIWGSKRNNTGLPETTDPQSGCKVIRFAIDGVPEYTVGNDKNGLYFDNVQEFQLWELQNTTQNAQPTISHDQKYLISKMNAAGGFRIRIFDLETLTVGGAGDYSKSYIHELYVPSTSSDAVKGVEIQGMASDGNFLYFYGGRGDIANGAVISLHVYTLFGEYVDNIKVGDLGLYDSANYPRPNDPEQIPGTISETESINVVTINGKPTICLHFAAGNLGYRPSLVYALGTKQGNFRGDRNTAAMMLSNQQGGISLAFPRYNQVTRIGTVDYFGAPFTNIQLSGDNVYLGGDVKHKELPIRSIGNGGNHSVNFYGNSAHYRDNDSSAPVRYTVYRSRSNGSNAAKKLEIGDYLYELAALGDDGTKTQDSDNLGADAASILFRVRGTVSSGKVPTSIDFYTCGSTAAFGLRWQIAEEGHWVPGENNTYSIGSASNLVSVVYAGTGTINTSDERLKQQFRSQSEREKDAALEIKNSIQLFKFNDAVDLKGDGARWHVGVKAQQVISILESHDLDPFEYAFVCFDEWDETEDQPAGSRYAVRYDELAMFIIAAM